jgi:hypothetical protein
MATLMLRLQRLGEIVATRPNSYRNHERRGGAQGKSPKNCYISFAVVRQPFVLSSREILAGKVVDELDVKRYKHYQKLLVAEPAR